MVNPEDPSKSELFQNNNLKVNLTKRPSCVAVFDVEVSPEAVKAAYQKAVKNVSKEISIPGFRKGKAPESVIKEQFGKFIDKEWRDVVVETSLDEAIRLANVRPIAKDAVHKLDLKSISLEDGARIYLEIEHVPDVPVIGKDSFSLKKLEPQAVTEKEIENTLNEIRLSHATWTPLETPVSADDWATVKIEALTDTGETRVLTERSRYEVKSGKMANWLINLLSGKKVGDIVEGHDENEVVGKPGESIPGYKQTNLKIEILANERPELPEVNDEFAAKVGLKTKDELLERIQKELEERSRREVFNVQSKEIINQIRSLYAFDLPEKYIKEEKKLRFEEAIHEMRHNKVAESLISEKKAEIESAIENEVKNDYRLSFLVQLNSKAHEITLREDEVMRAMFEKAMMNGYFDQKLFDNSPESQAYKENVKFDLLTEKLISHFIEHAKYE